jgi:signal transduction histidine kinase
VALLGYWSLRQWQHAAEILLREQARDMAAMAAEKVQMVLSQLEHESLARLQAVVGGPEPSAAAIEECLRTAPLFNRLLLVDRGGRPLYPETRSEADRVLLDDLLAQIPRGFWESGGRREVRVGDRLLVVAVLRTQEDAPVLAVLSRDDEKVRRTVLEGSLAAVDSAAIIAVMDQNDRRVYTRGSIEGAEPVATVTLREGLPDWRLALYEPRGSSPREMVRRQVAIFTGAFGVLLGLIVTGIVATYRLMRRESEMARLKADFVANVSHDLKTPLSVIRMFGETLEMGRVGDEERRREYYRVITRESERLSRLIDNVLDFSRIEGGRQTYDLAPAAVEPLVRETLEAFSYPLAQQGFEVEVHVSPELPEVEMDQDAVGQALANLIDNAIKYSGERRAITVEAGLADGQLALTVADRGIGIPRAEQARIFEKFYRVGRSETQGRGGSGVGLALVRHVAEAHGGRVTVESEPGQGSRFTLWLPLRHLPGGGRTGNR